MFREKLRGQGPCCPQFKNSYPLFRGKDVDGFPAVEVAGAACDEQKVRRFGSLIGIVGTFLEYLPSLSDLVLLLMMFQLHWRADDYTLIGIETQSGIFELGPPFLLGKFPVSDVSAGVGHHDQV